LASNSVLNNSPAPSTDKLQKMIQAIAEGAQFVEQLLAATGVEGANAPQIQTLTTALSNLAAIAIEAAHAAAGKEITAESVMSLLPVSTPLVSPAV
jgi:hypothetical protein